MIAGAYERPEGPEDISPPPVVDKTQRSFESVLAAEVLHSKLGNGTGMLQVERGALAPHTAEKNETDDTAIDCLMSLSSATSGKRKSSKISASAAHPAPRRRLKMRLPDAPPPAASQPDVTETASDDYTLPLPLLSSATVHQLSMLAAAFKLCPAPSKGQIDAISVRVEIPSDRLQQWFESRQVLQDWMDQQPQLSAREVKQMFYPVMEASALP